MKIELVENPELLRCKAIDKVKIVRRKNQEAVEIYHVCRKDLDKLYEKKEYPKRW